MINILEMQINDTAADEHSPATLAYRKENE